jgi:hypothetical protein
MSLFIQDCRGTVHIVKVGNETGGKGFFTLQPEIPQAANAKVLLMGSNMSLMEITQPSVTLDDQRALYVFGSAWNDVPIIGLLLLGPSQGKGAQLTSLLNWYASNRVGKKMGPVEFSMGTSAFDVFVTGLAVEQADPHYNRQSFVITAVTPEAHKG